jgi:hypothetical protein
MAPTRIFGPFSRLSTIFVVRQGGLGLHTPRIILLVRLNRLRALGDFFDIRSWGSWSRSLNTMSTSVRDLRDSLLRICCMYLYVTYLTAMGSECGRVRRRTGNMGAARLPGSGG